MNRDAIQEQLFGAIRHVAPEAELDQLAPDIEFRDQIDIDSFDFLNIVIGIHEKLGVDIPEADYPRLFTLRGALDYLEKAVA
jgi:acyl carrier protein